MKHVIGCLKNPYVALVFCIVGLIAGPLLVPFGVNFADEPYQIINAMDTLNTPLAPLTSLISGFYGSSVGYKLIYMRLLSVLMVNLSIVLSGLYAYSKIHKPICCLYAVGISALMTTLLKDSWYCLFGWDSFSVLFTVSTVILLLRFTEKPTITRLLIAAVVAALTSLFRVPNTYIVAILVLAVLLTTRQHIVVCIRNICVVVVIYAAIVLTILTLTYGSISAYFGALSANAMGAHSISSIILQNLQQILRLVPAICTMGVAALLLNYTHGIAKCISALAAYIILVSLSLLEYSYNSMAIAVMAVVYIYLIYINRNDQKSLIRLILLVLTCYTTACGSNVGMMKYVTWPVLPLLLAFANMHDIKSNRVFIIVVTATFLSLSAIINCSKTFYDKGMPELNYTLLPDKLHGMRTSASNATIVNEIYTELSKETSDGSSLMIIGNDVERYLYEYAFGWHNTYLRHNWDHFDNFEDTKYVKYVEDIIIQQDAPKAILLLNTLQTERSQMQNLLNKYYYVKKSTPQYTIYVSNPIQ